MTTENRLVIKVDSTDVNRGAKSLDDLAAAGGRAEKSTDLLTKSTQILANTARAAVGVFGLYSLASIAREAVQAADGYTKLTAQLTIATKSASQYAQAIDDVKRISSTAQADIIATSQLYSRLNMSLAESGRSQAAIARITETVSLGLKVNGASAQEASSAMLQLSQAFGSGVLRGEEFNAIAESAPNLLRTLADSMGVTYGELRKIASEGKITSDVLAKALSDEGTLAGLRKQAESMQTISGAMVELKNQTMLVTGEFMKNSGATAGISAAIGALASGVAVLGNNLGLVSAAISGATAALVAFVAIKASAAAYEFATALIASRVAALAAAEATYAKVASDMMSGTSARVAAGAAVAQAAANMTLTGSLVAATAAMKAFLLSNPIGWATLAIGAGVTAWMAWGNEAEKAGSKGETAIGKTMEAFKRYEGFRKERESAEAARIAAAKKADEDHQKAINSMITTLQKESDTYGMTAAQVKIYEAAKLGMSKAQLERTIALIEDTAAMEASAKAEEDVRKIILDTDPVAAASAEWERLIALKAAGATDAQITAVYVTKYGQVDAANAAKEAKEVADAHEKEAKRAQRAWENFTGNVQRNLGDVLYNGMNGSFQNIGDAFKQMLLRMSADAAAAQLTQAMFGSAAGGGALGRVGSTIAGFFGGSSPAAAQAPMDIFGAFSGTGYASFAGGGFTGNGSRSGGVDGMGGFPAILHPNETVVDHAQGQNAVPSVTIVQNINIDSRTDSSSIMAIMSRTKDLAKAEILNSLMRGGDFARATGRA